MVHEQHRAQEPLSPERLREEIRLSQKRSVAYGLSKTVEAHERLTPAQLEEHRLKNKSFLDLAMARINEFYWMLSPEEFAILVVDKDGYILYHDGGENALQVLVERNCTIGFRWTEKDVGTSAISLCHGRRIPVQLSDGDHYREHRYSFSCCAAPVFEEDGQLLGILVISGKGVLMHSHTLVMIVAAARYIEQELRVTRHQRQLEWHTGILEGTIDSIGTGLMLLDQNLNVCRVSKMGKQILRANNLEGKPLTDMGDPGFTLESIRESPELWNNREWCLLVDKKSVHLLFSARAVYTKSGDMAGVVISFVQTNTIRTAVENAAGSHATFMFDNIIGASKPFLAARRLSQKAANTNSPVLLHGETGTGKEMFAQAIHNASDRHGQPFVPLNCGAIPQDLLESELFGYVQGAFTGALRSGRPGKFELASGGTLLLDEIGDMPHSMQLKLLRVLQTGEVYRIGAHKPVCVDTRIIACTHVDLTKAIAQGRFREDLYYRLNVFPIHIPSLRERGREDILSLASYFLQSYKWPPPELTPGAKEALADYAWPGNVRELENVIRRAVSLLENNVIDQEALGLFKSGHTSQSVPSGTLQEMERRMIHQTLAESEGNRVAAARLLGISRATLYRKMREYDLTDS